ncbi:1-phosphatidylinositol 4,5-bisphosphate phosphodiesterase delta-3 isoform X1 [Anolis carolinensis]|uniref:Phosphoinositide phospholipase C n=1 Tax=Anolis carolinensis TaxID=28377 RepID=A0A803SY32_ANOCA|nr:PREDICTED: 1-phosphatidylinositol 4,5-bisphosphate phosphodiesterase delta-3 isoform X1 [Anolis carolinensis]|eukprot:XP_008111435.1 PREDICTED: 1-phosphatidylinositol 4,5-bisphosphate phosphodiesterase delta-3 isoform X1 [Anolis carolinensis]
MICGKWKKSRSESHRRGRHRHHQQQPPPPQTEPPVPAQTYGGVAAAAAKLSGHRAFKKLGLTDDDDIKVMLRGSFFWKVKTHRPRKQRLYRLQEDGMTIWFETRFKKAYSQHVFSILHIESVREGYQSEGLRKYGGCFPEDQCFTIVFRGKRKNLDLAAISVNEAQQWVRGLKKLMARGEAMSQREKLEHWIHDMLHQADKNKDNKMSFKEIKNMLRMINIDMNDIYAYRLFKECDRSNNDRLEEYEIEEFCTRLMERPELKEIFHRYSGEDCVLSAEELREFLHDQGEEATIKRATDIIQTYELNERARQHNLMMLDGFMMYLLSSAGDVLNQNHTEIYQDMSQPLCHYFISSSHNTYLTDNQIGGASSTEAYIRALMKGCRCVELDCWEGSNGEPIIYHGHTLTSKILFRDVIESIRDYAFKHSSYPLILSLENHCGLEQQSTMARHMKAILGDMLLTQPLDGDVPKQLPSPEQLKWKILVKGKKLPEGKNELDRCNFSNPEEEMQDEEDDRSISSLQEIKPLQAKDAIQISRELSDVVVYCQAVPFQSLSRALHNQQSNEMSSFSERKARKLIKESGNQFVRYNTRHLSRIYPQGLKVNSSNYNPQEMWNAGCQLVALNFQTPGAEMDLNDGRFSVNGSCGYVLKPAFLRNTQSSFDPEAPGRRAGQRPVALTIKVITAQQLPKLNKEKNSSIVDPFVRIEIYGVPVDCCKKQTEYQLNNGFNPRWNETLTFQVRIPELALVRFVVEDYDTTSANDFVGQFTLPLLSLREGYRHIHLLSKDGTSLSPATLFVHVRCKKM